MSAARCPIWPSSRLAALACRLAVADRARAGRCRRADGGCRPRRRRRRSRRADRHRARRHARGARRRSHRPGPSPRSRRRGVPVNLPRPVELGPFSLLERKESEQDLGDGTCAASSPLSSPPTSRARLCCRRRGDLPGASGGDVRTAQTPPVPVKIASLIANEPEPALKDIAPPVQVQQQRPAGSRTSRAACWRRRWARCHLDDRAQAARRVVALRPGPPPRPAHEVALEKLDRLGAYGFLENADNRPFYFAVSEVIREYLGARFGFDSLELTTDELMAELRRQRRARAGAGRDRGLAVGLRPGEVREDLAQRRRGARHAGDGDPDRDVDPPAPTAVARGGRRRRPARRAEGRAMDEQRPPTRRTASQVAPRASIPYALIAAVLLPVTAAYSWVLRNAEGFRFAHPGALALIPIGGRAGAVGRPARAPAAAAACSTYSRAAGAGRARPAWWRACAICPWCCGWPPVALVGAGAGAPADLARRPTTSSWRGSTSSSRWTCRARCRRPTWCPTAWTPPRW